MRRIVEHLLSEDVGVSCMEDLPDVEEQYLTALLPPVPRTQLIRAFKAFGSKLSKYQVFWSALRPFTHAEQGSHKDVQMTSNGLPLTWEF